VIEVKMIPSLPDPNNGKMYDLQVGAFSRQEAAADIALKIRNAGFNAVYELSGSLFRVIVKDIPSSMVYYAAQRLGVIGIREIWLKEIQQSR
jgi:cell division septation protein DedD